MVSEIDKMLAEEEADEVEQERVKQQVNTREEVQVARMLAFGELDVLPGYEEAEDADSAEMAEITDDRSGASSTVIERLGESLPRADQEKENKAPAPASVLLLPRVCACAGGWVGGWVGMVVGVGVLAAPLTWHEQDQQ